MYPNPYDNTTITRVASLHQFLGVKTLVFFELLWQTSHKLVCADFKPVVLNRTIFVSLKQALGSGHHEWLRRISIYRDQTYIPQLLVKDEKLLYSIRMTIHSCPCWLLYVGSASRPIEKVC